MELYRTTPRTTRAFIKEILEAGLVPFVQSSPGLGKSTIMRSVAKELDLALIDHRLSTSAPEDLSGLPTFTTRPLYTFDEATGEYTKSGEMKVAEFCPFADLFPIRGMQIPQGKQGWMVFLDEFNSASKSVSAAAYKLILDRMTGQHHLHDHVVMSAAGNLSTDRAITNPMSTAMQSRVIHLEMQESFEEWLYDVALPENYDARVIAYLSQYPSKLMDFRPNHNEKTFCCPRTWEYTDRLIRGKDVTDSKAALLAGTITSGTAVDFVQFTKVYHNMVTIADIRRDPMTCKVPDDSATKWAVISHMMEKVDDKNFDDLSKYADRFDMSFRILFFRSVLVRQPALKLHPAFIRAMSALSKYLNG